MNWIVVKHFPGYEYQVAYRNIECRITELRGVEFRRSCEWIEWIEWTPVFYLNSTEISPSLLLNMVFEPLTSIRSINYSR